MDRLLDSLERRFGHWTIPHFPLFIVMANAAIYFLQMTEPMLSQKLVLDLVAVRAGEWWRLVTFLFVPPPLGLFWFFFWILLIFSYSQALEHAWGEFRFCIFYWLGGLATIVAAVATGSHLSNLPLNTTLFLAFATLYPDERLYIFFVLPIRVKYLAGIVVFFLGWEFVTGSGTDKVAIIASLINYLAFLGPLLWQRTRALQRRWIQR